MAPPKRKPSRTPQPPLLRLPLELRQQIYAHLLPQKTTSHPLPGVGFTQVSHAPPTAALLNIHPQLTDEILSYFYTISTWTLIFSHAFNFFRIDPDLRALERSHLLRHIRKITCILFCDVLLLKSGQKESLESFCAQIRRRVSRAADVLMQAPELRLVTLAWLDSTAYAGDAALEAKARVLAPLRRLKGRARPVEFRVGRVQGVDDGEGFAARVLEVLGEERMGFDGAGDGSTCPEPAKLRMLAFDPKQDPLVYRSLNQERFARVTRSNAVTGTGVWRTVPI